MCHYCGEAMDRTPKPGFNETCGICGKDLHVCLACAIYKPGAHRDCAEIVDQTVLDKDRRNHCDWFALAPRFLGKTAGAVRDRSGAEEARRGFEGLFGGHDSSN